MGGASFVMSRPSVFRSRWLLRLSFLVPMHMFEKYVLLCDNGTECNVVGSRSHYSRCRSQVICFFVFDERWSVLSRSLVICLIQGVRIGVLQVRFHSLTTLEFLNSTPHFKKKSIVAPPANLESTLVSTNPQKSEKEEPSRRFLTRWARQTSLT